MIFSTTDILLLSNKVLSSLSSLDNEIKVGASSEQLVFPIKNQKKGTVIRKSEQELRLLFLEALRDDYTSISYSIETPTTKKYKFGESHAEIVANANIQTTDGQSALIDLCIHEITDTNKYDRTVNIEFKHKNCGLPKISKDILKLMKEPINGAFIHLLDNTDSGTLVNNGLRQGVLDKLRVSFESLSEQWCNTDKSILIIILSLEDGNPVQMVSREMVKKDLLKLDKIFFKGTMKLKIQDIPNKNGWN